MKTKRVNLGAKQIELIAWAAATLVKSDTVRAQVPESWRDIPGWWRVEGCQQQRVRVEEGIFADLEVAVSLLEACAFRR